MSDQHKASPGISAQQIADALSDGEMAALFFAGNPAEARMKLGLMIAPRLRETVVSGSYQGKPSEQAIQAASAVIEKYARHGYAFDRAARLALAEVVLKAAYAAEHRLLSRPADTKEEGNV